MAGTGSATPTEDNRKGGAHGAALLLVALVLYLGLAAYSGSFFPLRLVKGTSMEPTLKAGDIAVVKAVPVSRLKLGDVIAFDTPAPLRTGGTPKAVLHRITGTDVKNGSAVFTTKGDNAASDAFPVQPSAIKGIMVARIPKIGLPAIWLTSRQGIMFFSILSLLDMLYIPAMVIFYTTVLKKPGQGEPGQRVATVGGGSPPPALLIDAVEHLSTEQARLSEEQARFRESILKLSSSIDYYATHLESHTAVVRHLAETTSQLQATTDLLKKSVEFQGGRSQAAANEPERFDVPPASDNEPSEHNSASVRAEDLDSHSP